MDATLTVLRDWSLGALAVAAMGYVLMQVIKWNQAQNTTWTAETKKWGEGQQADKQALAIVLDKVAISMERTAASLTHISEALGRQEVKSDKATDDMAIVMRDIHTSMEQTKEAVAVIQKELKCHRKSMEKKQ